MTKAFSHALHAAPRALVLFSLLALPMIAINSLRGGEEDLVKGGYEASNGAGLVLMISLKRAR